MVHKKEKIIYIGSTIQTVSSRNFTRFQQEFERFGHRRNWSCFGFGTSHSKELIRIAEDAMIILAKRSASTFHLLNRNLNITDTYHRSEFLKALKNHKHLSAVYSTEDFFYWLFNHSTK